jgi:hypothetical protein
MSADPKYEKRYCAYVDIIGFRELIEKLRHGKRTAEKIKGLLEKIHKPHDPMFAGMHGTDFRAQSISDAVALSTKPNAYGLTMLVVTVRNLACALLREGYLTRGAICTSRSSDGLHAIGTIP